VINSTNKRILEIFRAYDVRGLFPDQLNEDVAYAIGRALASTIGKRSAVAVGRDVRSSSIAIHRALCDGITAQGVNVIDLGEIPSPVLYFITRSLELAAGAMITASHLPPNWNGIKFCDSRGIVISDGTGLEAIKQAVTSAEKYTGNRGKIHLYNKALVDYVKYVSERINIGRKLSVVFDYGNSVTANVVPLILAEFGLECKQINTEQGNFRRSSELTSESMGDLKRTVLNTNSDLGIAYDADGDRVGFVDNLGNIYPTGESIIPIFASNALALSKGEIIIDVTCSSSISEFISQQGGTPVVIRVGHSYCANEVLIRNALFGAQYSGHYSFPEMGCSDDAIFASLKMIEILSRSERSLSQLVAGLPVSYASKMVEVECPDSKKFLVVATVSYKAKNMGYRVEEIDGVKIYSKRDDREWVLVRASNTSPIIRINADGKSRESSQDLLSLGVNLIIEVMHNN
jgi:phosphomannomutase